MSVAGRIIFDFDKDKESKEEIDVGFVEKIKTEFESKTEDEIYKKMVSRLSMKVDKEILNDLDNNSPAGMVDNDLFYRTQIAMEIPKNEVEKKLTGEINK